MSNFVPWLLALACGLTGLTLSGFGTRILVHEAQVARWRQSLTGFELRMPRTATTDDLQRWLVTLTTLVPQRRRWSLLPHRPICVETTADQHGIRHIVLVPGQWRTHLLSALAAALPGARLEKLPLDGGRSPRFQIAVQLRLRGATELLAVDRDEDTSRHLLAALQPLNAGEIVRVQWLFTGAPPPRYVTSTDAEPSTVPVLWRSGPVMRAICRVAVASPAGRSGAKAIFRRVWAALLGMNTARTQVARAWRFPRIVAARLAWRAFPAGRWPMALTTAEIAGLLGVLAGETGLPGVAAEVSRVLPPSPSMPKTGLVIARSNYPGTNTQLHLSTSDRLRHMWILGPTGTGKSTLLCNIISHDIAHGDGVVLIDAGGDLVTDVLDRIPESRAGDIIVIDPTHADHIIGLNPLTAGPPEQAAGFTYHVLRSIYEKSWGPRTADIVRAALLTLTATTATTATAFTLVDIPELLTNASFRRYVTTQPLPHNW
ncbi:MAG: helicase HerA domain-containing protein [Pseudonocardiaceae bacterium]